MPNDQEKIKESASKYPDYSEFRLVESAENPHFVGWDILESFEEQTEIKGGYTYAYNYYYTGGTNPATITAPYATSYPNTTTINIRKKFLLGRKTKDIIREYQESNKSLSQYTKAQDKALFDLRSENRELKAKIAELEKKLSDREIFDKQNLDSTPKIRKLDIDD